MFKIITEREVTKHLEKCKVTCCLTYVLDITGTHALLACCHTSSRWNLLSCKIWLQWRHSRIDEQ